MVNSNPGQPIQFVDEYDKIMFNVRHCNNYGHTSINPLYKDEMPIPVWGDPTPTEGKGWFCMNSLGNTKDEYRFNGFTDFNWSPCTNKSKSFKYKWLLGKSEHVGEGTSAPPEWGRANWKMKDCDKGQWPGTWGKQIWYNRDTVKAFRAIHRTSCNLSRKYYWGLLDSHYFNSGSYVKYNHASQTKSNYVRAKGITFRYQVYFEETTKSPIVDLNNKHGMVPLRWAALAFVSSKSEDIHLAELISNSLSESKTADDPEFCKYPVYWTWHRRIVGQSSYNTDWRINYVVKDKDTDETTDTGSVLGGGPWDEFGPYAGKNQGQGKPPNAQGVPGGSWGKFANGVASMTLSKDACNKIWDDNYLCVGILVGSSNTSRKSGYVGSSMHFDMWDVKLLEMDFKGDNNLPGPESEISSRMSNVLREPMTVRDTWEWMDTFKSGATGPNVQATLDMINPIKP